MWQLNYKESGAPKNCCFWTVLLEKTLESPLNFKEVKPVNPKGNQSWIFVGRTDAEAETSILWQTDSFENTLMLGKIEGRRRRGQQRMRWLDGITDLMCMTLTSSRSWWGMGKTRLLQSMGQQRFRRDWATELNYGLWFSRMNAASRIWLLLIL